LICLSLFSSAIFPLLIAPFHLYSFLLYSFTCIPNILNSISCSALSLYSLLHILSWYQSINSKPLHTVWRAARSSTTQSLNRQPEHTGYSFFTRLGEQSAIRSKDRSRKLARGSRVLYAQKIEGAETSEGESVKNREHLQIRQRFMKKSCRRQKHLNNSKKFVQFRERLLQKAETSKDLVKLLQICERLLQRAETFKEFMKFFQICERFTNFPPQEKIFAEAAKNTSKEQRTTVAAVRSVLLTDLRSKSSSERMRRAQKRQKNFSR
jgi:hypothetical protein